MSDEASNSIFSQLTAALISHGYQDKPWNTDIKHLVEKETRLEPQQYFDASDSDYLSLYTKTGLAEFANDVEIPIDVSAMKKADAVLYLNNHEAIKNYFPQRLLIRSEKEY